ncbi:MAG: transcriptional repressor [Anaerolineae bacterium]|jgi:Fur family ferric uptake transcriptional regulator
MYELQELMKQVRGHGLRLTRQRVLVLQALCELGGHASAEDIYEQAVVHRRDLDLSTVYRTLERFRDLRILSQTDLGRGCAEYEIVTDRPHHHLVCQRCGRVIDLDHSYLAATGERIRQDLSFEPIFDHFAIFGQCRKCRGVEQSPPGNPEAGRRAQNGEG